MLRKTKIICTLGPSCDNEEVMRGLMQNGMDCARMNFSHGDHEEHLTRLNLFRKVRDKLSENIPVLLDTKGPEIRTGVFKEKVTFEAGKKVTIKYEDVEGDLKQFSITYKHLHEDLKIGDRVLIDDGLVGLRVEKILPNHDIECIVENGGDVSSKKSINLPGVETNLPFLSPTDISDIKFAVDNGYDYIALSFVRKGSDVATVRRLLDELDGSHISLISKIENQQGIDNIDDIIRESDGVMIARGDLGVEIPVESVPVVQKKLIKKCLDARKIVITATQMLDSMIRNPRPTRAESSDVANAIFDGTSCTMLSGETANGRYPIESLQTMARIAENAEHGVHYWRRMQNNAGGGSTIMEAISSATCNTAMLLNAAAIVTVTKSGGTVRSISHFHPECPIVCGTTDPLVNRQLRLYWGVHSFMVEDVHTSDELFDLAVETALKSGLAKDGDLVVITGGVPVGMSGTTNMLKAQMLGNILATGKGLGEESTTGAAIVINTAHTMHPGDCKGKIVIARDLDEDVLSLLRGCLGVVVERNNFPEQAHIASVTLGVPIIVSAGGIMRLIKDGQQIQIDAKRGIVKPLS